MLAELTEHAQHHCHFLLGEQIHLQIQMRASIGFVGQAILAGQDEEREENRFKTHNGCEQREREGVERLYGFEVSGVEQDPGGKPDDVKGDGAFSGSHRRDRIP